MNQVQKIVICAGLLLASFQHALADGGNSNDSELPSESISRFDPVKKYQQGIEHLKEKRYRKAQAAFKKVLSVARKDANTHFYLGLAYYHDGKLKKARKPFEKSIKYNKSNILAKGYLGATYLKLGHTEKASKQTAILLELEANCKNCTQLNDIKQSLQLIETALNGSETSLQMNFKTTNTGNKAYISAVKHINQGNYSNALAALNESATRFGPHPDILTYQGFANRKLGNYDIALDYYTQALTVDASHKGANEYLGEYYVELGNIEAAKNQLATLEKICNFGCEEAEELRRWIVSANPQ